jgi:4-hydroxy-tetrahydrodipicolinate reductase
VGRSLVAAIAADPSLELTGAVARRETGRDAGEAIGIGPVGVALTDDLGTALAAGADALIDYTHPDVIREHLAIAFGRGVPVVIGTTGLTSEDFAVIDADARRAGVGAATGNFAVTAALLQHLAKIAAQVVPQWEVLELNPATKPDVPSGTARELAEVLGEIRPPHVELGDDRLIGPPAARGATFGGARVHSVRLPGCSPWVEVIFGLEGERLVLRHDQQPGGQIFVTGSLLAARRIQDTTGLIRGLDTIMFGEP